MTDIDMVDEDWWMGTNPQGERGLFPANYVELVEGDDDAGAAPPLPSHPSAPQEVEEPAAAPQAAGHSGPTATAVYDYEAAEDNELSFPEGATITGVVSFPFSIKPRSMTDHPIGIPRRGLVARKLQRCFRFVPSQLRPD